MKQGREFVHSSKRPLATSLAQALAVTGQRLRAGESVTGLTLKVGSAAKYWAGEQTRQHGRIGKGGRTPREY